MPNETVSKTFGAFSIFLSERNFSINHVVQYKISIQFKTQSFTYKSINVSKHKKILFFCCFLKERLKIWRKNRNVLLYKL